MLAKLKPNQHTTYSLGCSYGMSYAFAKKVDDSAYELLHSSLSCKDYTHEMICNAVHKGCFFSTAGTGLNDQPLDKLQMAIFFNKDTFTDDKRKALLAAKKYFSELEAKYGFKKTLIRELDCSDIKHGTICFLLTLRQHYVESPVLLHALMAALRTFTPAGIVLPSAAKEQDIMTEVQKVGGHDDTILRRAFKHNLIELLFKNHNELVGDLSLEDVYPQKSTTKFNYHSGYGLVALFCRELASAKYAEKLYPFMTELKIN